MKQEPLIQGAPPPGMTGADVARVLLGYRLPVSNEAELQGAMEKAFRYRGVPHRREVTRGADRIDFVIDRVGIECKVDGSVADVTRQLDRYALWGELDELLVVTTRGQHLKGQRMSLIVYTAPMGFDDPDILIISRKFNETAVNDGWPDGHRGVGLHFCPSRRLQSARWKRCGFHLTNETPDEWQQYESEYIAEMRESYRRTRKVWNEVLQWDRVVIVSRDDDATRSPRTVLAQVILPKMGAQYMGEV